MFIGQLTISRINQAHTMHVELYILLRLCFTKQEVDKNVCQKAVTCFSLSVWNEISWFSYKIYTKVLDKEFTSYATNYGVTITNNGKPMSHSTYLPKCGVRTSGESQDICGGSSNLDLFLDYAWKKAINTPIPYMVLVRGKPEVSGNHALPRPQGSQAGEHPVSSYI